MAVRPLTLIVAAAFLFAAIAGVPAPVVAHTAISNSDAGMVEQAHSAAGASVALDAFELEESCSEDGEGLGCGWCLPGGAPGVRLAGYRPRPPVPGVHNRHEQQNRQSDRTSRGPPVS